MWIGLRLLCKNCSLSTLVLVPFSAPHHCHHPFITNFPFGPLALVQISIVEIFFHRSALKESVSLHLLKGSVRAVFEHAHSPVGLTSGGDEEKLID